MPLSVPAYVRNGWITSLLVALPLHGQVPSERPADPTDPCLDAVSADAEWTWVGNIAARPHRELTRRSLEGVGERTLSRVVQLLRRAMTAPPVCSADAIALAALSTALQDRVALREAREALEDHLGAAPDDAVAALWLARAAVAAGAGDAAEWAQTAVALGADATGASLAAARAGVEGGRDGPATAAYFQGLAAVGDGDGLAGYIGDLGPLVRPDEARALVGLEAEDQTRWLARFWIERAVESGVTPQERIAEHYRRVRDVYRRYCRSCVLGPVAGPVIPYGRVGMGLDDRGLLVLLRGEPTVTVGTAGIELPPNESWAWGEGEGRLAVHLAVLDVDLGWQVLEDPLALVNPVRDPLALDEEMPDRAGVRTCVVDGCEGRYVVDFYRYLVDRGQIDPRFRTLANHYRSRPADWGENAASGFIVGGPLSGQPSFRFEAEEDLAEIRGRDVFHPGRFALSDVALRTVAFRDSAGPGPSFLAIDGVLPDSAPVVARVDVTLGSGGGAVQSHLLTEGAADHWVIELGDSDGGGGPVAAVLREGAGPASPVISSIRAEVTIDRPPSEGLQLSDLIVWEAPEGVVDVGRREALTRLRAVPRLSPGAAAALFFEIYGLGPEQVFETRIRVAQAESGGIFRRLGNLFGGDDPSELRFTGESGAPAPVRERSVSIALPSLDPGRYRVEVEVRSRLLQAQRTVEIEIR